MVLMGSTIPSFTTFFYYYMTDVAGISQILVSWLSVISYATLLVATFMYNAFMKEIDIRWMTFWGLVINMAGAAMSIMFIKQIYLGLSPAAFLILSTTLTDTLF